MQIGLFRVLHPCPQALCLEPAHKTFFTSKNGKKGSDGKRRERQKQNDGNANQETRERRERKPRNAGLGAGPF